MSFYLKSFFLFFFSHWSFGSLSQLTHRTPLPPDAELRRRTPVSSRCIIMLERANKNSTNRVKNGCICDAWISKYALWETWKYCSVSRSVETHTNWVAAWRGGKKSEKKTLMSDRNIFCIWMEWCSIVIFPCGAYIYILLHGFGIKLKLSSGVRASGEYNLLWHSPAAEDWIISRARLPACTFTLGDVPQSTDSFSWL